MMLNKITKPIYCNKCGTDITFIEEADAVFVNPCQECLDFAEKEAFADGETAGYDRRLDERDR